MQRNIQENKIHKPRPASLRKDQLQRQESKLTLKESIANKYTNFTFKLNGGFQKISKLISFQEKKQYCTTYIQGKKITNEEHAIIELKKIIWFTYRQIRGISEGFNSDTNWGCLIRVGQMALASALQRYFRLHGKISETQINNAIIFTFLDDRGQQEKYSLTKIVNKAMNLNKNKKYGDWFNASEISQVLSELHNRDPMKGTDELKLINFSNSVIFLDQVYKGLGYQLCKCQKRRVLCQKCHSYQQFVKEEPIQTFLQEIDKKQESMENKIISYIAPKSTKKRNLLLFVTTRLGLHEIEKGRYNRMLELLSLEFSLGIMGGIPRKGLYFVGYEDDKLIYLDPHYVQDEVTKLNFKKESLTFYCNELRKVGRQSVDASMAFVFYIENLSQIAILKERIDTYNKQQNGFLSMEWENAFNREQSLEFCQSDDDFDQLEESFIA